MSDDQTMPKPAAAPRRTRRKVKNEPAADTPGKPADAAPTPLDHLLAVMRDETADPAKRLQAARDAAPYLHPRLASVQVNGDLTITHEDALTQLDHDGDDW